MGLQGPQLKYLGGRGLDVDNRGLTDPQIGYMGRIGLDRPTIDWFGRERRR